MARRRSRGRRSGGFSRGSFRRGRSSRPRSSFRSRRAAGAQRVILQIQQPTVAASAPAVEGMVGVARDLRGPRKARF